MEMCEEEVAKKYITVYHVFNDGEDEEGRPPTPGPVGVWLMEKGEEGEGGEMGVVCEEVEKKDITSPMDMTADTMQLDTLEEDDLPTVEDTQFGSWCIAGLRNTADDIQVLTMRTSRGGFRPTPAPSRTALLICRIGMFRTR